MHKHPHHYHETPLLEEASYTNIGDGVIRVEMKGTRAIVYLPDWVIKVVVPDRAMPAVGRELYLARKDGAVLDITIGWDKHQIVNDKHGPHEETFQGVKAVHLIQKDGIQEWVALNYTPDVSDIVDVIVGEEILPLVVRAGEEADRAEAAADAAEEAVDAAGEIRDEVARTTRGRQYSTRQEFVADADYVNGVSTPPPGTVVSVGGKPLYVKVAGSSDILGGLPGWDAVEINGTITSSQFDMGADGDDAPKADRLFNRANGQEVVIEQGDYNFPAPDGYDVYLFAGGGNMAGENAGPITLPADGPNPRILIVPFTSTTTFGPIEQAVEPLKFPFRSAAVAATSVGPALRAAKHMLETTPSNRGIIIVPVASSGTSLVSGDAHWAVGNGRYNLAINAANAAMSYGSGDNRFRGIFWQHGESDALANISGEDYMAALAATVGGWRSSITGAERAILTILGPVPEWEALGLGSTASVFREQRRAFSYIQRASFRNGETGNQTAPDAITFNRTGARLSGYNAGLRLQMFAPPDERSAFYTAPEGSRALFKVGANFSPARMRGVIERWERQQVSDVAKRDIQVAFEWNDEYRHLDSFGQWDSSPVPANRPYNHFVVSRYFKDGDPIDSFTTAFLGAVSEPGSKNMLNSLATTTLALGENDAAWGAVFVVSNGENVRIPEGNPRAFIGVEIDVQPCQGTNAQSGAGLLVNSFIDPVNFAGVAIVGDQGGEWLDGIFLQNIKRNMIYSSQSLSCEYGLNLNAGLFSQAAISLGVNRNQRFLSSAGVTAAELYSSSDRFLNVQLEAGLRVRGRSSAVENEAALVLETRSPSFTQFAAFRSATGTGGNTAASTLTLRGNSITGRSLNAGGTINASGADYAEYERIADGVGQITKGQVVGFDAAGRVTDKWVDSVSFAVKSTNPSIVGGDVWWADLGDTPEEPKYICPVGEFTLGDRPVVNGLCRNNPDLYDNVITGQVAWDEAHGEWEAACAEARAEWEATTLKDWQDTVLAPYEAALEDLRQQVDRIAYCGKVPVNVLGAVPGQYVVPVQDGDGIGVRLVDEAEITFGDYRRSVGQVRRILEDGRAEIAIST